MIFDVDGTIANTEEEHRKAFNRIFKQTGLDWVWTRPVYHRLLKVAGGRERILHYIQQYHPDMLTRPDLNEWIQRMHQEKTVLYNQAVESGAIPLRIGFSRLAAQARDEGLRLAIATTTSRVNVESLLSSTLGPESLAWFEAWGTGESARQKKPSPDVYLAVLAQLDLPAGDCLAVEDSANGLRASLGAGIPAIITESPYTRGEDFAGALAVMDHLGEPGRPMEVSQGFAHGKNWVDLELLRLWHSEARN
ncbi:MAG: HAD-IA family hydrolase [Deltaproteobacteria bacterium]|nr:HAD-IA family hydrolase [Deltaproteobacteria bacterium]